MGSPNDTKEVRVEGFGDAPVNRSENIGSEAS